MIKKGLIVILLAGTVLSSCKENPGQTNKESAQKETITGNEAEIIRREFIDSHGKNLEILFNKAEDEAIVIYRGDSINLKGQKPASGIWYKNYRYELRGKGEQVELRKDGQTIFKN